MLPADAESRLDEVLLRTKAVNALQRPSNRDHRSLVNWFAAKKPLVAREAQYIDRKEDLVSLYSGRECGGFDGLVERFLGAVDTGLGKCNCHIIKVCAISGYHSVAQAPDVPHRSCSCPLSFATRLWIRSYTTIRRPVLTCW